MSEPTDADLIGRELRDTWTLCDGRYEIIVFTHGNPPILQGEAIEAAINWDGDTYSRTDDGEVVEIFARELDGGVE